MLRNNLFSALKHSKRFGLANNQIYLSTPKRKSTYSHSVILPRTTFPQKLEGEKRKILDQKIVASYEFLSVYRQQYEQRQHNQEFILHDGPPYANGDPHLGHAVNKILKDITNRWKMAQGFRVHYRPGWDCHGLPIELRARQQQKVKADSKSSLQIREMARNFAAQTMESQKKEFMSWGIMGDWDTPYTTMAPDFVKNQMKIFLKLYQNGTLFQRYMPVYWSPSSKTALAESELEYNLEHKSNSIYVRFPIAENGAKTFLEAVNIPKAEDERLYLLIWTTTPWTLVANKAVCVKADACYVVVKHDKSLYIVAKDLLSKNEDLSKIFAVESSDIILREILGRDLMSLSYTHPLREQINLGLKDYPVLCGDHVTMDVGTGLVHTAPAHGPEDYLIGISHNLDLSCQVDELGRYSIDTHIDIRSKFVLDEGNAKILDLLHESGDILLEKQIQHSYPYDWRTKKPVLLRASKQWFVDTKKLQEKGLRCLQEIEIHPKSAENGFQGVLENRPYWCVSRQRVWGVPIPTFYDSSKNELVSPEIVDRCCKLVDTVGTDFWWQMSSAEILGGTSFENVEGLTKGQDIFDVWLDSGITWHNVIKAGDKTSPTVVDLYLEGLDQFSGWFYSSLLTSLALQGRAPYKQIFVHGFTLDEKGRKMSKSLGNVIPPSQITEGLKKGSPVYGVDVLRWWVAAHGSQGSSIIVGKNLLDQCKQDVDRLRNVTKFMIGTVPKDMDDSKCLPKEELLALDLFMLHSMSKLQIQLGEFYDKFLYNKVCLTINHFVSNQMSSFYFHLIKDRLYCEAQVSLERRSAISTLWNLLKTFRSILAPITPILVAEMAHHHPSLQLVPTEMPSTDAWIDEVLAGKFENLLKLKNTVNKSVRDSDELGSNELKQFELVFNSDKEFFGIFRKDSEIAELFQVPCVHLLSKDSKKFENLQMSESSNIKFGFVKTSRHICPRCRLFLAEKTNELCLRCFNILN